MVLYVANADGSGERPLLGTSGFDYNASFSPDGEWIVFTSERAGSGQADIYRVRPDGSSWRLSRRESLRPLASGFSI
jgi:Tol biopolymer transport system component